MSTLRPECIDADEDSYFISDATALYLIHDAIAKRRSLIRGRLDRGKKHCAVGWFFHDHPNASIHQSLIDEVSAVNDSVPSSETSYKRWKKVMTWLQWRLKVLSAKKATS